MFSMMAVANSEVLQLRRAFHQPFEIVRDALLSDGALDSRLDQLSHFGQPMKSNIITPESITELGLMTSLSAYFGAVPCVASKQP
jgi:hypothetical protein